jgi:hypothetical protein
VLLESSPSLVQASPSHSSLFFLPTHSRTRLGRDEYDERSQGHRQCVALSFSPLPVVPLSFNPHSSRTNLLVASSFTSIDPIPSLPPSALFTSSHTPHHFCRRTSSPPRCTPLLLVVQLFSMSAVTSHHRRCSCDYHCHSPRGAQVIGCGSEHLRPEPSQPGCFRFQQVRLFFRSLPSPS